MSEFPHDDFAKAYLTELLSCIGNATPNRPFKSETRLADLWFQYDPDRRSQSSQLGLLGRLLTRDSLIEVFRNPATFVEIRACQSKLSHLEGELLRQVKRQGNTLRGPDLPDLWLIMPTASADLLTSFAAQSADHPGVYSFPQGQRAYLVVVHKLVQTPDTLWLRMLGRNGKQQRAIAEFAEIPTENGLYASIEELLADYRTSLENRRQLTQEDEVLIMQLSEAYLKRRQEWRDEGVAAGREEGREVALRSMVVALLREGVAIDVIARTTNLSVEAIEQLRQTLD